MSDKRKFLWFSLYYDNGEYFSPIKMTPFLTLKLAIEEDCNIYKVYSTGDRELWWENPWCEKK
jgi:hypothetical protein